MQVLRELLPRLHVGRVEDAHHLRAALVDVLVLEVLGVREHVVLAEEGVRHRDIVVARLREDGAPAAPGDVGEADVVAEAAAPEEERDAEGALRAAGRP